MADADDNQRDSSMVFGGNVEQGPGSVIGVDKSKDKTVTQNNYNQYNNAFFVYGHPDAWKHVRRFIALLSGLGLIATVIVIATLKTEMSDALYTFLRIVLALGAAAFAVCFDGFLRVRFKTWLRATGGFAVFVIIFFFQVAKPTSSKADSGPTSLPISAPSAP